MFQWCVSQVLQQQEEREVSKSFAVVPLLVCIQAFVYTGCPKKNEGDGKTGGEDGWDGDHSVFLIEDPFID